MTNEKTYTKSEIIEKLNNGLVESRKWQLIKEHVDQHGYMSGIDRMSERVKDTHEIFTPTDIVIKMVKNIGVENMGPGKSVLDPSCGDGQFLVTAKWVKVYFHNMSEDDALKDIYGVDIMRDNVDLCKKRLGGGNIIMGDTLNPTSQLTEQTKEEQSLMIELFSEQKTLCDFFG